MKKSAFSLLMGLFVVMSSFAQESFMRKFENEGQQWPLTLASKGDFYYYTEYIHNKSDSIYGTKVYLIDLFGQLIKESFMAGELSYLFPMNIDGEMYLFGTEGCTDTSLYYVRKHIRNDLTVEGVVRLEIGSGWKMEWAGFPPTLNHDGSISTAIVFGDSVLAGVYSYYDASDYICINPQFDSLWYYSIFTDSSRIQLPRFHIKGNGKRYIYGSTTPFSTSTAELIGFDSGMGIFKHYKFDGEEHQYITEPSGMVQDNEGNIFISGTLKHSLDHAKESVRHIYLAKYNADLEFISDWTMHNSADTVSFAAFRRSLVINDKGELIIGGQLSGQYFFGEKAMVISKLDSDLNELWTYYIKIGENMTIWSQTINTAIDDGCVITAKANYYRNKEEFSLVYKIPNQPITTSIEDEYLKISPILISPNPGRGQMRIDLGPQLGACQLELFDLGAKLMIQTEVQGTGNIINTSALPAGTYVYKISNSAGWSESGKWVKE